MKPYRKPIMAVDSEWCVMIDDKMKHRSIEGVFLRIAGWVTLFGLTCFGLIGGVTSQYASNKLASIDEWFSQPANERLAFYYFIGVVVVFLGLVVSVWAYKRWGK